MPYGGTALTPTNNKGYSIHFEDRKAQLYVQLKGTNVDFESSRKYWFEIFEQTSRGRYRCVLIERDLTDALTPGEIFQLISNAASVAPRTVKFAVVDHNLGRQRNELEEVVATNRGLNIRIFDEMRQAEEWLLVRCET